MFGALLRAAPQALFVALLGAVTARIMEPLLAVMVGGSATQNDMLVSGLQSATDNFVLIGVLALLVTLLARAVLEARAGRV